MKPMAPGLAKQGKTAGGGGDIKSDISLRGTAFIYINIIMLLTAVITSPAVMSWLAVGIGGSLCLYAFLPEGLSQRSLKAQLIRTLHQINQGVQQDLTGLGQERMQKSGSLVRFK